MENASKALIIAGAILVSILIISAGMLIFSSSSGLFNSAKSSMSDQEAKMFNQKFTMYEGENVSGSSVRQLMRDITVNNNNDEYPDIVYGEGSVTEVTNALRYTVECTDVNPVDGVIDTVTITQTTSGS